MKRALLLIVFLTAACSGDGVVFLSAQGQALGPDPDVASQGEALGGVNER